MSTFKARGTGGADFELDALEPGTVRGEVLAGQIRRGELVALDAKGEPVDEEARAEMLAPFFAELEGSIVGEPIIAGTPGPAVPIDDTVDPDRPQIGDALDATEPAAPPAPADVDEQDDVPEGKAADVVDWVRGAPEGDDPVDGWEERARRALAVERAKDKPGKGLVTKLEEIVAAADEQD